MNFPVQFLRWPRNLGARAVTAVICGFSTALGTAIAVGWNVPVFGVLLGSGLAVAMAVLAAAVRPKREPATDKSSESQPLLQQLNDELASLASPADVAAAVERAVRDFLPCNTVAFTLSEPHEPPPASSPGAPLESGAHKIEAVALPSRAEADELTWPVAFHGVKLGRLKVSRRPGAPAFTVEQLAVLRAIAHEGALALAQALAYTELDLRRKQQAAAWRDEREALVETLSAEIAHEIRYPINFFRSIFVRAADHRVLDEEDVEIGCEEVERLERMVSGLRRMATQHIERQVVQVSELCGRAEALVRDRMADVPLTLDLEDDGVIRCDVDKITQVLVNLLANAFDAVDGGGEVGVSWRQGPFGGELAVWDTGPGFGDDPSRLFAPWYTTKQRGTGLGLAISYRLVRGHGWSIEALRRNAKTVFVVALPLDDVLTGEDRHHAASGEVRVSAGPALPAGRKGEVA